VEEFAEKVRAEIDRKNRSLTLLFAVAWTGVLLSMIGALLLAIITLKYLAS